jgi:5'-nucleotidase
LLGVSEVMNDYRPDIIFSGINRGGNIGEDVIYSGTVAAAMEGALLGIPSIAFSQVYSDTRSVRWDTAEHWLPIVIKQIEKVDLPTNALINVNFPSVKANSVTGIEITRQGQRKIGGDLVNGIDPRGKKYYWIGPQRKEVRDVKGTDLEAVVRGAISITPLTTDLTHTARLKKLKAAFK